MSYALIADLGGTNARFALAPIGQYTAQEIRVLPCKEYATLFDSIDDYIAKSSIEMDMIAAVVLAIAGPVNQEIIRFSNNPWQFSHQDVQNYFGASKKVALLNDFDAIGHCLAILDKDEYMQVGEDLPADKTAPAWVVGAGTGLGVSCVIPQTSGIDIILPGEGGHVDLPTTNEQEDYIVQYLRVRHGRVSAERVLSGMGIENIYAALADRQGIEAKLTAQEVGNAFLAGDKLATACMEQFFVFLGRVIGDLILNVESRGGVFIAGGIIPRYKDAFIASGFRQALEEKGRMKALVSAIPVYIITAEHPGLMGCANYATYLVENA